MKRLMLWIFFLPVLLLNSAVIPEAAYADVILNMEAREYSSCPYVYVWNGVEYMPENDIYSVGRGQNSEFIDYLNINNNSVAPKDGVYAFEIREIQSEKSWTDKIQLITIDHPADSKVGVDSSGNVHSYSNPGMPDAALNKDGSDILSAVIARDSEGVSMYHNDSIVLDFSSIDITDGAKLVLRINGFEGEATGSAIAVRPSIQIQTLENGAWVTRHTFLPKEEWAEGVFDLKPFMQESRLVRLLASSCFENKYHLVDYIALDNTADNLRFEVLNPLTALSNGSTDVLDMINQSDNVYAFLTPGDYISLTFAYRPLSDEVRDFAIVSEGYYMPVSNTYYVDTWNGTNWINRASRSYPSYDYTYTFSLGAYLPDPAGEYKVRVRNSLTPGYYGTIWAYVDYMSLNVNTSNQLPVWAQDNSGSNILTLINSSNNVYWTATNKSAIVKFSSPNLPPVANPGGPYIAEATSSSGASVSLDGSGSYDPENQSLTYRWTGPFGIATGSNPTVTIPIATSTVSLVVNDGALNSSASVAIVTVQDTTAPVITGSTTPPSSSNGWYNTNVTVHFTATDSGSGIESVTPDTVVSAEGTAISVTGTATDKVGNTASYTVTGINIDKTAPVISGSATTPANANGWYNTDVTVHFTATDERSGIQSVSPDAIISVEGASQSVSGTAKDKADNTASTSVNGINIDKTSPVISITGIQDGAVYTLCSVPTPGYAVADNLSGVDVKNAVLTGGNTNGVGKFTYTVSTVDKAGNSTVKTATYTVVYNFGGFLPPVSLGKPFKFGSTIPVKFQLADNCGSFVPTAGATIMLQKFSGSEPAGEPIEAISTVPDMGISFRYDATGSLYIYNLNTKSLSQGTWQIIVFIDDTTVKTTFITIKP